MIEYIISRGLDAPAKFAPALEVRKGNAWYRRKLRSTTEARNGGRVRVHIFHGLNISHKELIYLLQKSTCPRSNVLLRMILGEGLVGVNHRVIPTSTHKEYN